MAILGGGAVSYERGTPVCTSTEAASEQDLTTTERTRLVWCRWVRRSRFLSLSFAVSLSFARPIYLCLSFLLFLFLSRSLVLFPSLSLSLSLSLSRSLSRSLALLQEKVPCAAFCTRRGTSFRRTRIHLVSKSPDPREVLLLWEVSLYPVNCHTLAGESRTRDPPPYGA